MPAASASGWSPLTGSNPPTWSYTTDSKYSRRNCPSPTADSASRRSACETAATASVSAAARAPASPPARAASSPAGRTRLPWWSMWYLKSSATAVSVPPRARPLREVELEAGRREHVLADPLVLIGAGAGDAQAAENDAIALDRHAALGGHDGPVAHPADLGEEHRVGVAPVLQHLRGPLHDGRGVRLGQRDIRRHRPGTVHPLDQHDEPAVVDHGDAQRLAECQRASARVLGQSAGFGEGQGHAVSVWQPETPFFLMTRRPPNSNHAHPGGRSTKSCEVSSIGTTLRPH